jgi:hypothetical protein
MPRGLLRALLVIIAIAGSIVAGGWFVFRRLFGPPPPPDPTSIGGHGAPQGAGDDGRAGNVGHPGDGHG